jgi:ribonuclease VapC
MSEYILDSSAVVALLREERTDIDLRTIVPSGLIGLVNYSEVIDRFAREGHAREWIEDVLAPLELAILVPDVALATEAAMLRPHTRPFGLSLGDRFCLALSLALNLPLVTTDLKLALAAEAMGGLAVIAREHSEDEA